MKIYNSFVGRCLVILSIIPVIITGVILTYVSTKTVYKVKYNDTIDLLEASANQLVYSYGMAAEGDYTFEWRDGLLYLGNYAVNEDYKMVDDLKELMGVELSLFFENTRIVSTLMDENGNRLIGLDVSDMNEIWERYTSKNKVFFDTDIDLGGKEYFGYYIPFCNNHDRPIGMVFAGVPSQEFKNTIHHLNTLVIVLCVVLSLIMIGVCAITTTKIFKIQSVLMEYITELDKGNFGYKMPQPILKRKDEYGFMGRKFVQLNQSMQNLIQNDGLTGLLNRRAAMRMLNQYVVDSNQVNGSPFTFVIGDIDFFKKVNDTYGHNCGDAVLKAVSDRLLQIPKEEGFVSRWGGEEFVIVYKGKAKDNLPKLEKILEDIRNMTVEYDGLSVKITMTFGVSEYIAPKKLDWLISNADVLLYKGKENGRNQIVS